MSEPELRENTAGKQSVSTAEEEVPFVPYAAEAFAESEKKNKQFFKYVILLSVIVLLIIVYIVMQAAKKNNFYRETVSELTFDYRLGEAVMEDSASRTGKGDIAKSIAESFQNRGVRIRAVQYYLNNDRTMHSDISEYEFTHNGEGDMAEIEIGTVNALFSKTQTVRRNASGVQIKKGSDWEPAEGISLPHLYDYCFAISSYDNNTVLPCDQAYETYVNGSSMICEIWRMQTGNSYFTVYRYYKSGTLKAIRVLNSQDDLMCVYEIKGYTTL